MNFSLPELEKDALLTNLREANIRFHKVYPGDKPDRQPVHTVYGGANLFKSDTCIKMGEVALKSLQTYSPDFATLARVLEIEGYEDLPDSPKKIEKLARKLSKMDPEKRKKEKAWIP